MFASFVTSSSTLIGFATRNADADERVEGAKAKAADEEQSAVTTAREENCMIASNTFHFPEFRNIGTLDFMIRGSASMRASSGASSHKMMEKIIPS